MEESKSDKDIIEKIRDYARKSGRDCTLDEMMDRYGKEYEKTISVFAMPASDYEAESLAGYKIEDPDLTERDGMLIQYPNGTVDWMKQEDFDEEYACVASRIDRMIQEYKDVGSKIKLLYLQQDYSKGDNTSQILLSSHIDILQKYRDILKVRIDYERLLRAQDKRSKNLAAMAEAFRLDKEDRNTNTDNEKK